MNTIRGITCVESAFLYVESILHQLEEPVVIDISGDGEANCFGEENLSTTLDRFEMLNIQINSLFVHNPNYTNRLLVREEIDSTFYESLTRNFGFTLVASSFEDFEEILFRKLSMEVSMLFE